MTVRSIEEVFSIWIRYAVAVTFLLILTFSSMMYINNYQNNVIEGQRVLIHDMMSNPNCLVPSPNKPPVQSGPSVDIGSPGAADFPEDEQPSPPDMRREGWFI
jgi:hypothetical protein